MGSKHEGRARARACVVLTCVASFGCSSAPPPPPPPPVQERPQDAILSIARTWEARYPERGLRSSSSPIASYDRQMVSRITLVRNATTVDENLQFTERYTLREGGEVRCSGEAQSEVVVAYGRRAGEPAIELTWPALVVGRNCDSPAVPATYERLSSQAVFVLRSDQLVPVSPVTERRTFLPAD